MSGAPTNAAHCLRVVSQVWGRSEGRAYRFLKLSEENSMSIAGDNPIRRQEDDALGRLGMAKSFARQVLALDVASGVVVGVLGPWGSGKTSFVNLAREEFNQQNVPILDFNPWMFSGAEQLVESFFIEISAQLKALPGFVEVGKGLEEYGEAFSGMGWLPLVGPWIERASGAAKVLGKVLQNRKQGIGGRREAVDIALAELRKPIVVVLDDIDRLSTNEIRDVFKLVRLTASFPNIVYVLAFDRERVEEALGEQGVPGRAYLEKILQVAVDLPVVPFQVLNQLIFSAIDGSLADIEKPGRFDEQVWPDVFMEVIRPLIRNMRDVRRYAAAIHGTVRGLEGQIALADVLSLEAIRVFLPDVFKLLHQTLGALTGVGEARHGQSEVMKAQVEGLLAAAGPQKDVVQAMIERLFPAGQRHIRNIHYGGDWRGRWLRERRVAHDDILRFYLERVVGEGLKAFTDAELAFIYLPCQESLNRYLRSLEPTRQQDVIASLEEFEDQFTPEHVVSGVTVLLNLLPDLPKREREFFGFDTRMVVSRVTYRLLKSLNGPYEVETSVDLILPELSTLSSKLSFVHQVGYREGSGHKLVSEVAAARLEKAWRTEVATAPVEALVREPELLWVIIFAKQFTEPSDPPLSIDSSPEMTLALLRASKSEILSQTDGSRAIKRTPRLAWKPLVDIFGDEETLRARIDILKATNPENAYEILELASKYLEGWRPDRFE